MGDVCAEARRRMQKVVNEASEVGDGHGDPFEVHSEFPHWDGDGIKSDTLAIGPLGEAHAYAITRALAREVEK